LVATTTTAESREEVPAADLVLREASRAAGVTDPRVARVTASDAEAMKVVLAGEASEEVVLKVVSAEEDLAVEVPKVVVAVSLVIILLLMKTCFSTGTRQVSRTSAMRRRPFRRQSSTASLRSTTRTLMQRLLVLLLLSEHNQVLEDPLVRVLK
jgi:hypothetical protein